MCDERSTIACTLEKLGSVQQVSFEAIKGYEKLRNETAKSLPVCKAVPFEQSNGVPLDPESNRRAR